MAVVVKKQAYNNSEELIKDVYNIPDIGFAEAGLLIWLMKGSGQYKYIDADSLQRGGRKRKYTHNLLDRLETNGFVRRYNVMVLNKMGSHHYEYMVSLKGNLTRAIRTRIIMTNGTIRTVYEDDLEPYDELISDEAKPFYDTERREN